LQSQLDYDTTYYWKVVADDGADFTFGPLWFFATQKATEQITKEDVGTYVPATEEDEEEAESKDHSNGEVVSHVPSVEEALSKAPASKEVVSYAPATEEETVSKALATEDNIWKNPQVIAALIGAAALIIVHLIGKKKT